MTRIRKPDGVVKAKRPREPLPNRPYHRIGDVARWLGVEVHTVREWSEWFAVRPIRSSAEKQGQRVYSRQQCVMLGVVRELLYVELYTVEGAKRQLRLAKERLQAEQAGAA